MDRFTKPTGRSIEEWETYIVESTRNALVELSHKELAQAAADGGSPLWWAQAVSVEIEKRIGRRVTGQTCTGSFSANGSKTVPGEWTEMATLFDSWAKEHADLIPGEIEGEPRITETEKWRYWRATMKDESQLSVNICAGTGPDKAKLAINHDRLADEETMLTAKVAWKKALASFAEFVSSK